MTDTATANPETRVRNITHRSLRPVVVAESLAALRGPDSGVVELPQRLCRSGGQRVFDMSDADQVLDMYESLLEDARTQDDLAEYANGELLARLWSEPFLPPRVREAWEDAHPLLAHPLLRQGGTIPDITPAEPSVPAAAVA